MPGIPNGKLSLGSAASRFLTTLPTVDTTEENLDSANHTQIAIADLQPNRYQPRTYFDSERLQELANSIKRDGVLQPILVRPCPDSTGYEIIAGERRYRAAQLAGLKEVPATIREFSDRDAMRLALSENVLRQDLNPVEKAEGILDLVAFELDCSRSHVRELIKNSASAERRDRQLAEETAQQVEVLQGILQELGYSSIQGFRNSILRSLDLDPSILETVRAGKLDYTKAIEVAKVKDIEQREQLLQQAIANNLSVRAIKQSVRDLNKPIVKMAENSLATRAQKIYVKLNKTSLTKRDSKEVSTLLERLEELLS